MPLPTSGLLDVRICERIEKYGLPKTLEKECFALCEEYLTSHPKQRRGYKGGTIDSVLLLLCRRHGIIEPVALRKAASGHYLSVLEELDGVAPADKRVAIYVRKFFEENPYPFELLAKALDVASKLPLSGIRIRGKNPRILASACIYIASLEETSEGHKSLVTQSELAEFFKVTTAGIRLIYVALIPKLIKMNTKLSKEEIEWWLSFRKMQLEKGQVR